MLWRLGGGPPEPDGLNMARMRLADVDRLGVQLVVMIQLPGCLLLISSRLAVILSKDLIKLYMLWEPRELGSIQAIPLKSLDRHPYYVY